MRKIYEIFKVLKLQKRIVSAETIRGNMVGQKIAVMKYIAKKMPKANIWLIRILANANFCQAQKSHKARAPCKLIMYNNPPCHPLDKNCSYFYMYIP